MSDIAYLTIAEASEWIRNKTLSPVDYTQSLLDRIETFDDKELPCKSQSDAR